MWFCSERRDSGRGTRDSAGSRSRDPGPGTGDRLKAASAIEVSVGCIDPGRGPEEAQRIRPMMLGFTRMKSGLKPTYVLPFLGSPLPGPRSRFFAREAIAP